MAKRKLKVIAKEGVYTLYEYKPTLFHPLYDDMDPLYFVRWCRFAYEMMQPGGYRVYYLGVGGDLVGYSVLTPGGRRLKCSTKEDVVEGPSFTKTECRGKGYGSLIKQMEYKYCCQGYRRMVSWVHKGNIGSLKMCEKCGLEPFASLDVVGIFRKLVDYKDINGGGYVLVQHLLKAD